MRTVSFIKVTRRYIGRDFIVGVEYFDTDTFHLLQEDIVLFLEMAIKEFKDNHLNETNNFYALTLKGAAHDLYPDRHFFLEIGDDSDSWVQVYTPDNQDVIN